MKTWSRHLRPIRGRPGGLAIPSRVVEGVQVDGEKKANMLGTTGLREGTDEGRGIRGHGDLDCPIKHLCHFKHGWPHGRLLLKAPQCYSHKALSLFYVEVRLFIAVHQQVDPPRSVTIVCPVS